MPEKSTSTPLSSVGHGTPLSTARLVTAVSPTTRRTAPLAVMPSCLRTTPSNRPVFGEADGHGRQEHLDRRGVPGAVVDPRGIGEHLAAAAGDPDAQPLVDALRRAREPGDGVLLRREPTDPLARGRRPRGEHGAQVVDQLDHHGGGVPGRLDDAEVRAPEPGRVLGETDDLGRLAVADRLCGRQARRRTGRPCRCPCWSRRSRRRSAR